ncbi:MAG: HDIG domain-containing protein [Bacteroidetes bacterium]|nr:HDIG domain-containing protein [Bacteroidota bacterium]
MAFYLYLPSRIDELMKRIFIFLSTYQSHIIKGVLFLFSVIILVVIFPKEGKFKYEFQKGKPWMHRDLIASYDFAILKPKAEYEEEKQRLISQIKPYFIFDDELTAQKQNELFDNFERNLIEKYPDTTIANQRRGVNWNECSAIFDSVSSIGILENIQLIENLSTIEDIVLIKGNLAKEKNIVDLLTIQTAYEFIQTAVSSNQTLDQDVLLKTLESSLFRNIKYDREKTQNEQESALNNLSQTRGMVQAGERIISKGELVSTEKHQVLESMKQEYQRQLGSSVSYYMILIGLIVLMSISMMVLFSFLLYFRRDIFLNNTEVALILLVILMMVFVTSLVIRYNVGYLYLVPICIIPIIIRAFFDTRPALYVHIITIIIIGFLVPNSFEFVFLQLIAGITAIISVVHLQRRAQFFISSLTIFLTYSTVYVGLTLIQEGSFLGIDWRFFLLFLGSAVLTLFSYPLIYIFEKLFGLITDVTLIELSNANNKLLRRLSSKAPGTFQHSMQVANLAEEILFEIGGNTLLARTGALYHDIGKMFTPAYFIENQQPGINPHDQLTPDESARIIVDHVCRGVELARRYKLPKQIIDFIVTHQGDRKAEYFYYKKVNEDGVENVDEKTYSYPGPIPMSRETAVVMMADSVEAASRSLKHADEESLSNLVEGIIEKQIGNKQFVNSNITFKEITRIKELLKKKLLNIYHVRIEYPEPKNG